MFNSNTNIIFESSDHSVNLTPQSFYSLGDADASCTAGIKNIIEIKIPIKNRFTELCANIYTSLQVDVFMLYHLEFEHNLNFLGLTQKTKLHLITPKKT